MACIGIVVAAIISLNPTWTEKKAKRFARPICSESLKRDIDPLIPVAVIQNETGWRPHLINRNRNGSVDYGLMQFNCDLPERVHMHWRKQWCDPKRRKYLRSVEGNIKAGIKELSFWRSTCFKKHPNTISSIVYKDINTIETKSACRDCFDLSAFSLYIDTISSLKQHLKIVLSEHWWVQHYNWNSKHYSKNVLYVYLTLKHEMKDNYTIVRRRHYTRFNSNKCLKSDDLCLKEYKQWQQKQNLRRKSRIYKKRSVHSKQK